MLKAPVKEHIRDKLVWFEINGLHIMQGKEIFDHVWFTLAKCYLRNKDQCIYNDQVFYYRWKPAGTIILVVTHYAKIIVMDLMRQPITNYNFRQSFSQFKLHYIFYVVCMRKHVYRLDPGYIILFTEPVQVSPLGSRIATDIHNDWRFDFEDLPDQLLMHSCPRRISNDHIRSSMLFKKFIIADLYYITGIEFSRRQVVHRCILPGIFDCFIN